MNDPSVGAHERVVAAHAKVNLFLRVLGRRADGYHDLESLVLPLDLADRVAVSRVEWTNRKPPAFGLQVRGRPELTRGVPTDETNLAVRAASALAARAVATTQSRRGSVRIRLDKRIPAAAGLGGGSADAAAVLRALNELWAPGSDGPALLSPAELAEVAAEVGSDVPALLAGGPVLVGGRGERVSPVRPGRPLRLVLVTFDRGVSTALAFGWWDLDEGRTGPDPEAVVEAFEAGSDPASLGRLLFNDLELPVVRRRPDVRAVLERLTAAGVPALMSGSGPTVFGLLEDGTRELDPGLEDELRHLGGGEVLYVETQGR